MIRETYCRRAKRKREELTGGSTLVESFDRWFHVAVKRPSAPIGSIAPFAPAVQDCDSLGKWIVY